MGSKAKKPIKKETLKEIRRAFADYVWAEGCACCENTDKKKDAEGRLGSLLGVEQYSDGSGYDFYKYASKIREVEEKGGE